MAATLLAIGLLHWVVLVTPGANVLVVSSLAASGARKAACLAALGVTLVAGVWSALAVFGVHAIFIAHPYLRLGLQVAGGLYLLTVAIRLWRSGSGEDPHAMQRSSLAAFRLGFLTNIMNPKSALFFGSVFATALPAEPPFTLLVAAVLLVLVNALCWHLFLAIAFSPDRPGRVCAQAHGGFAPGGCARRRVRPAPSRCGGERDPHALNTASCARRP